MLTLSPLEMVLIVVVLLLGYIILRLCRMIAVLRWGYISMSDWCASTIDVVRESARSMAGESLSVRDKEVTDEAIDSMVGSPIQNAKREWEGELDKQMKRLKANGVAPLGGDDKGVILASWFK